MNVEWSRSLQTSTAISQTLVDLISGRQLMHRETPTVNVPDRMHEWTSEVGTETYLTADDHKSFIPIAIWRQNAGWKAGLS